MSFIARLALLYAGLFGAIGIQLPFMPVWLAAKGLDERSIGLVLATATAVRVLTVPFGTRAADRFGSLKGAIVIGTILCALCLTALGNVGGGVTAVLMFYALSSAAAGTVLPVTEAYALNGLTQRGRAYGPVRVWGSAAFIGGALLTGLFATWIAPVHIIWVLVAAYWLAAVAALSLEPVQAAASARASGAGAMTFLRNPAFVAVILASGCIQASHALFYAFGTLQWSAAGMSGASIAALWSLSVLSEIVLFAYSSRLPPAVGPLPLLGLGAAGAIVRWAAMALGPPDILLPVLQILHALSFGATHLGAVLFVARSAPPGLAATAQGLLATANGGLMASAMAASGLLNMRYGIAAYAAMAVLAAMGAGATLLAWRFTPR